MIKYMQENMIPRAGEMIAIVRAIEQTKARFTARKLFLRECVRNGILKAERMDNKSLAESKRREKAPQQRSAHKRHRKNIRAKKADRNLSFFELGS